MYGSSAIFFTPGGIFLGVCGAVAVLVWVFAQTPRAERSLRWRVEFAGVLVVAAIILLIVLFGMML
jgi:heme/copper-type cytochrome/quinol oxidase subunit 2